MSTPPDTLSNLFGPDGFHELLEDMHRVRREPVESSILAHLLRHREYRKAFLKHCGIGWPEGDYARVRCEVSLKEGGRADLVVDWSHQGERRILIEHKPWAPFTPAQPANYLRHLRKDPVSHGAFVLLADEEKRKEATRRILQSRVVPNASSGSTWAQIEGYLKAGTRSRSMKCRSVPELVESLAKVDGPPLHRSLAEFWRSRHAVVQMEISDADQARVRTLHERLRLADTEPELGPDCFGVYLWAEEDGRHAERLWFGVEPLVARQVRAPDDAILVLKSGYLPPKVVAALDAWAAAREAEWQPVQAGDDLPEQAIALPESDAAQALTELVQKVGIRRKGGRKPGGPLPAPSSLLTEGLGVLGLVEAASTQGDPA